MYIGKPEALAKAIKAVRDLSARSDLYAYFKLELSETPLFKINIEFGKNCFDITCGFTLIQQQGCCGILVSTKTFVTERYRGQGYAKAMMPLKEALAREFGYSSMLATVNMTGNPAEVHILQSDGWVLLNSFVNSRTKNTVGIFSKNL